MQPPKPNLPPVQSAFRFTRATDGKTRVDSGNMSVISNPAAGQTILLDHVKKTANIQPAPPPVPQMPGMPQMPQFAPPGLPSAPKPPNMQVQDLGKSVLQGHEVEGKRFVFQPPPPPKMPAMPKPPQMPGMPQPPQVPGMPPPPQVPGMPQPPQMAGMPKVPGAPQPPGMPPAPQAPQMPQAPGAPPVPPAPGMPPAPQMPTVAELWTSTSMRVPMLTKMSGAFGQLTQVCQRAVPGEPHPAAFQIPPDYKVIMPPQPKPPTLPG